ncbi:IRK-interacting protein, partial [Linum perenne]
LNPNPKFGSSKSRFKAFKIIPLPSGISNQRDVSVLRELSVLNRSSKHLDPGQDRQTQFQSFVSLRNEVPRKGTKNYNEEFSKFCDQKMSCIITAMNWARLWPELLLQAFFVATKCIWLLHLLAFYFIRR